MRESGSTKQSPSLSFDMRKVPNITLPQRYLGFTLHAKESILYLQPRSKLSPTPLDSLDTYVPAFILHQVTLQFLSSDNR
jgi:hypothetical protein